MAIWYPKTLRYGLYQLNHLGIEDLTKKRPKLANTFYHPRHKPMNKVSYESRNRR